ncbi:MAG: UDP-N-acetylmuramate--L-alanine ligase [Thermodesulfovibrionales bacterium]|nr:UDP-N-acetylmuramate--L-alanine ligase [Thermodesulfovibrionales bacterium]
MLNKFRAIHFVGIGGIGMSGIAEVLHNLGYEITGSDIKQSDTTKRLHSIGIKVKIGHEAENIGNAHVVVISSAVKSDNPEVVEAKRRGIPVIPRAEMLAELGRLKYGILIAGAHGKTTTTSLLSTLMSDGGFDPTVVIGGKLNSMGSNARLGQGDFIIAEADESDGSFLKLTPTIAVVTNIDNEHLDFFGTLQNIKSAFIEFVNKVPFYGFSVLCLEDKHIREIIPFIDRRYITYGLSSQADAYAVNVVESTLKMSFDVIYQGSVLGRFDVPMAGLHNVLNSVASVVVAYELEMPLNKIRESLTNFKGIQRRLQYKGSFDSIKIFDDYGHHPTEIKATIKALKGSFKTERLNVIFQPHRYSRTQNLANEFADSFWDADVVYMLDIYPAGERPIEGVTTLTIVEKMLQRGYKNVHYTKNIEGTVEKIIGNLKSGDIILTLGAGDVYKVGEKLLDSK